MCDVIYPYQGDLWFTLVSAIEKNGRPKAPVLFLGRTELLQPEVPQQRPDLGLTATEGDPHLHVVLRAADLEDLGPETVRGCLIEEAGLLERGECVVIENARPGVTVVTGRIPPGDVREVCGVIARGDLRDQTYLVKVRLLEGVDMAIAPDQSSV